MRGAWSTGALVRRQVSAKHGAFGEISISFHRGASSANSLSRGSAQGPRFTWGHSLTRTPADGNQTLELQDGDHGSDLRPAYLATVLITQSGNFVRKLKPLDLGTKRASPFATRLEATLRYLSLSVTLLPHLYPYLPLGFVTIVYDFHSCREGSYSRKVQAL